MYFRGHDIVHIPASGTRWVGAAGLEDFYTTMYNNVQLQQQDGLPLFVAARSGRMLMLACDLWVPHYDMFSFPAHHNVAYSR